MLKKLIETFTGGLAQSQKKFLEDIRVETEQKMAGLDSGSPEAVKLSLELIAILHKQGKFEEELILLKEILALEQSRGKGEGPLAVELEEQLELVKRTSEAGK